MSHAPPKLIVREYRAGDEESILRGFNRAFALTDPNFEPRTMEVWRWVHQNNPAGFRIWLGVLEDGQVVNQQAGIPVRVLQDGEEVFWTQVVDSFTEPELARGLKKPGLFIKAARPFYQNYGGTRPDQDAYHYGAPVRSAFRIGRRFLGYEACRNQNKLRLDLARFEPGRTAIRIEQVERFPDEVGTFFRSVSAGRGAIIVRDAGHLNWRYADRPDREYQIALARDASGTLRGYAVFTLAGFDGEEGALLADWLVLPGDDETERALLAWAAELALQSEKCSLLAMLPDTCPEWIAYQRLGFRVEATQYFMVGRSYRPPYDLRWLYRNWYYTLGDFDLC